ncbi:hypothetical protein MRX96_003389 [Rhipicephalus microplus]
MGYDRTAFTSVHWKQQHVQSKASVGTCCLPQEGCTIGAFSKHSLPPRHQRFISPFPRRPRRTAKSKDPAGRSATKRLRPAALATGRRALATTKTPCSVVAVQEGTHEALAGHVRESCAVSGKAN